MIVHTSNSLHCSIFFVCVTDVSSYFLTFQIKAFYETDITQLISPSEQQCDLLTRSLDSSLMSLRDQLEKIQALVSDELITQSSSHLKQVFDIPRLYRRTNREVSNQPKIRN
jgi:hypothetical protein